MTALELSIIAATPEPPPALVAALEQFQAQHGVPVRVRVLAWDTAWAELVKVALYGTGPDISEVGTTWIDSFVSMGALRPFTTRETASLGGASVFLPSSWRSGSMLGQQRSWAVPWITDTRVIFYRRDLLDRAGVDEKTAFQTPEELAQTLGRLQESGVAVPWVMTTAQERPLLHTLACWVWGAGGHFISSDGRCTQFNAPQARAGIHDYFSLHRHLAPPARNLNDNQANVMFRGGQAAAIVSGQWLLDAIRHQDAAPEVVANLGLALVPGVPFVGGSNFVIWKHSQRVREALELARFLTSQQVQTSYVVQAGLLPARLEALDAAPFASDPFYQVIGTSLREGRGFQAVYMWGLIEDGLVATLSALWADVFENPHQDLEHVITGRLEPLAQSFDRTLAARR